MIAPGGGGRGYLGKFLQAGYVPLASLDSYPLNSNVGLIMSPFLVTFAQMSFSLSQLGYFLCLYFIKSVK